VPFPLPEEELSVLQPFAVKANRRSSPISLLRTSLARRFTRRPNTHPDEHTS
jgi:hypothetical protein